MSADIRRGNFPRIVGAFALLLLLLGIAAPAAASTFEFIYEDAKGKKITIRSVNDFPRAATTLRKAYELLTSDAGYTAVIESRRKASGHSGPYKVVFSDKSDRETCSYSSNGRQINMPIKGVESKKGSGDAEFAHKLKVVVAHEAGHAQMHDIMGRIPRNDYRYGPDGKHYLNEVTHPVTAFSEGWAEWLEMVKTGFTDSSRRYEDVLKGDLKVEGKSGEYTHVKASGASFGQLVACEAVNALILKDLAANKAGNEARLFAALKGAKPNDLSALIARFLKDNPDQAANVKKIVARRTLNRGTAKQVDDFIAGRSSVGKSIWNNITDGIRGWFDEGQAAAVAASRTAGGWFSGLRARGAALFSEAAESERKPAGEQVPVDSLKDRLRSRGIR